jgi:hypothetical protein
VNILSTTLDSKSHLQRYDQLVDHQAWKAEYNPIRRDGNDKYAGPFYTATRGTIVAETAMAACEIHPTGQLMLQVQDIVQIVVMDTQENLWLVQVPSNDPKLLAVPTNAGVDYKYEPASGYLEPYPNRKAPWQVAQRIVLQTFGLDPSPWSSIQKVPLVLDEFGLLQGAIHSAEEQNDWTFLGRHALSSERGGGFVYMYLVRNVLVPSVSFQSPNLISWTMSQVQEALLQGKFPDARSVATMTMGLLKCQQLQTNV